MAPPTKQTARKWTDPGFQSCVKVGPTRPLHEIMKEFETDEDETDEDNEPKWEIGYRQTLSPSPNPYADDETDSEDSENASLANEIGSDAQEEDADEEEQMDIEEESLDDHCFEISPNHSYGVNFAKDVENCLSGKIDFAGSLCHFELLPSAPNPCLNIDGLGSIGVPLNAREGKAISKFANGLKKIKRNPKGVNSWSIDASLVSFDNPQWTKFLQKTVAENVWSGLGVAPCFAPAECVLEKLVLYGPGPLDTSEESDKDEEAFSKIVIQLPSSHVGGQVHVSHQAQEHDIDLAEHPFATSILASYTSADLSFTPITEGYRLALVYNLVSKLPEAKPDLPTESLMTLQLRHIFRTWNEQEYKIAPTGTRFAYLLDQQKTLTWQQRREKAKLTPNPKDQENISRLRDAAAEFGFIVFSGQVHYKIHGKSNEGPSNLWVRDHRYGKYDAEAMHIVKVKSTSANFRYLVDVDGIPLEGAHVGLDIDAIAPLKFFDGLPPDFKSYEPGCGTLDYDFYRDAVLIVSEEEEQEILRKATRRYWLSKLETLDPAGSKKLDPEKIELILSQNFPYDRTLGVRLIKLALKWKDLDLWTKAIEYDKGWGRDKFQDFIEAWKVFSFQRLLPFFNQRLSNIQPTRYMVDFIKKVENHAPARDREKVVSWATEQYTSIILGVCTTNESHRVYEIARIGEERGAGFLARTLVPHLVAHPPSIDFIHALYYELRENSSTSAVEGSEMTAQQVASICLENVLEQPKYKLYGISSLRKLPSDDQNMFSRLKYMIRLYISTGRIQECTLPLRLLLHTSSTDYKDYVKIYSQTVTDIRGYLTQMKHSVTTAPFKYFFASVIGLHMQHLLDSTHPNFDIRIPKFGCRICEYCRRIDRWLRDPTQPRFEEQIYAKDRRHVEPFLARFDLAQHDIGPAYGYTRKIFITLTKHADLQTLQAWEAKVDSATAYLGRIGTDAEIASLMKGEYPKIQESLKGVRTYTASRRFKTALGDITKEALGFSPFPIGSTSRQVLTASSSNIQAQANDSNGPTNQKKRKTSTAETRPSKRPRIEERTDHGTVNLISSP